MQTVTLPEANRHVVEPMQPCSPQSLQVGVFEGFASQPSEELGQQVSLEMFEPFFP